MANRKRKPNSTLKQVREVKYRQRVVPDKKKELKKNPPLEED